jgi:hypothetical protein
MGKLLEKMLTGKAGGDCVAKVFYSPMDIRQFQIVVVVETIFSQTIFTKTSNS